jgi:hypothetical protein
MCSLPNIPARHLEELSQRRKKQTKKTEVETVKMIITDYQPIENSI